MLIQKVKIADINPATYNPRKDLKPEDKEYIKLKKSIQEFTLVEPLIWNSRTKNLIGGHQRLKILQEMGETEVEVSVVDLPIKKEKALNIALNKISGEWDFPKLKDLLQELDTGEMDMEVTGFDIQELEDLMTQYNVWRPDKDVVEGDGELSRRVIITFVDDLAEAEFWDKLGIKKPSPERILFRWETLNG